MFQKHYKESVLIQASPEEIFVFADDHENFSAHMTKSSWMMGGGTMNIETDEGHGQKIGSHIRMSGRAFGFNLFLDEVITQYDPPRTKAWETVGEIRLLVIGHYKLGFKIEPQNNESKFIVFIDYNLPVKNKWLGTLFGKMYAKWCVKQMINGVDKFNHTKKGKNA